jgi:PII-like signaling protein
MHLHGEARLVRIILGESDKLNGKSLYETIIRKALAEGLAGATAWHGEMGFDASSRIRTSKILDLSNDLPVIIEIVDTTEKINAFLPFIESQLEAAQCGGIITIETVEVHRYIHEKHPKSTPA